MNWEKKGHIFKPSGEYKWSSSHAQIPRALVLEDRIRIYYATRFLDTNQQPISQTSFIDVDKKDLTKVLYIHDKPILELGNKGEFHEFGIHPTMPLWFNKKVYLFYQGWQRGEKYPYQTEIGIAESNDNGFTFKEIYDTPILKVSKENPFFVNGVFINNQGDNFNMWYSSGTSWVYNEGRYESVYKIRQAKSKNLVDWKFNEGFCLSDVVEKECQNSATVIYKENKYHMWYCYRPALNFRNKTNGYRIGYATSEDLKTWKRNDNNSGIRISEEKEAWDSEMICYPFVFELEGRLIMLYCGNYFGKEGFGYAELTV